MKYSIYILSLIMLFPALPFGQTLDLDETLFLNRYQEYKEIKLGMEIRDFIVKFRSKEVTDAFLGSINADSQSLKGDYDKLSLKERRALDEFVKISKELRAFELLDLNKDFYETTVAFYKGRATFINLHAKCSFSELIKSGLVLYGPPKEISAFPKPDAIDKKKGVLFGFGYYNENVYWDKGRKRFVVSINSSVPYLMSEKEPNQLRVRIEIKISNNELLDAFEAAQKKAK